MAQKMELLLDDLGAQSLATKILSVYTRAPTNLHTFSAAAAGLLKVTTPSLVSGSKLLKYPLGILQELVLRSNTTVLLGETPVHKAQISSWVELSKTVPDQDFLGYLDTHLLSRTFVVSNHLTVADIVAYAHVYDLLQVRLSDEEKLRHINVLRWVKHLQSIPGLSEAIGKVVVLPQGKKPQNPTVLETGKSPEKTEEKPVPVVEETKSKAEESKKEGEEGISEESKKKPKNPQSKPAKTDKKGQKPEVPQPEPGSLLDIRVGRILKIWKHPEKDHIFCEEVDLGGEVRTIATGLVGHVTEDQLLNSLVVILANLKPRKMGTFISQGMVLCASHGETIEPLRPPQDSQPGDKVTVEGLSSEPLAELPPKKEYWEKAMKLLSVDQDGKATYNTHSLITPRGVVTSPTLKTGTIS